VLLSKSELAAAHCGFKSAKRIEAWIEAIEFAVHDIQLKLVKDITLGNCLLIARSLSY
jgi:hypothetical protein